MAFLGARVGRGAVPTPGLPPSTSELASLGARVGGMPSWAWQEETSRLHLQSLVLAQLWVLGVAGTRGYD